MPERSMDVEKDLQTLTELCAASVCPTCNGVGLISAIGDIIQQPVLFGLLYWHTDVNGGKARLCKAGMMRTRAAKFIGGIAHETA